MILIKYIVQLVAFFSPAFMRKILLKMIGFKIGKKVKIGPFSLILINSMQLDDYSAIDPFTLIIQLKHFYLGEKARIATFSKIYGRGTFIAKQRSLVSTQCLIECADSTSVKLGDFACLGPRNTVYTHGKFLPLLQGYPFKLGDVTLGDYSWTGMASTISPGTTIGKNTITTPMANLFGEIPDNSFVKAAKPQIETRTTNSYSNFTSTQKKIDYIKGITADIVHNKRDLNIKYNYRPVEEIDADTAKETLFIGATKIKFIENNSDIGPATSDSHNIYIGYDLPQEIKREGNCLWLDFMDYTYSCRNHKAQNLLVQRLWDRTGLKFITYRKEV